MITVRDTNYLSMTDRFGDKITFERDERGDIFVFSRAAYSDESVEIMLEPEMIAALASFLHLGGDQ